MDELVVIARFTAKPKLMEEVEEVLRSLVTKTHQEHGCQRYAIHRTLDDPATFVVVEKWTDQRDLEEHFLQPHVKGLDDAISAYLTGPPEIWIATPLPEGDPQKGTL
ncbi:MAG: putative quinol monooxygenase [Egibacteraceae bacterium]